MIIINFKKNKAQTIAEYTIVEGIIIVLLFAMSTMIKRAGQGMIKVVADEIGYQKNAEQSGFLANATKDEGYLKETYLSSRATIDKQIQEDIGETIFLYGDKVFSKSNALINMGFQNQAPD